MEKSPKISKTYNCELCNYNCFKQSEFNKHLSTRKHQILQNPTSTNLIYECECGKIYKHSSTLYAHKKKCIPDNNLNTIIKADQAANFDVDLDKNPNDKDDIIMLLLKQNTDLIKEQSNLIKEQSDIKQIILELVKNGTNCTTSYCVL